MPLDHTLSLQISHSKRVDIDAFMQPDPDMTIGRFFCSTTDDHIRMVGYMYNQLIVYGHMRTVCTVI